MNSITELNLSLHPNNQIEILSHEEFKQRILKPLNGYSPTILEQVVAKITKCENIGDGYRFEVSKTKKKKIIEVHTNGRIFINQNRYDEHFDSNSGRYRYNLHGSSVYVEKLIGIGYLFEINEFPSSLGNLVVNVMDCSANYNTAEQLGIKQDFSLDNLEFTLNTRNSSHGKLCTALFKRIGKVYRTSANDLELIQAIQLKDDKYIINYLDEHCVRIK